MRRWEGCEEEEEFWGSGGCGIRALLGGWLICERGIPDVVRMWRRSGLGRVKPRARRATRNSW